MSIVRDGDCGCLRNKISGNAIIVCPTHVRDVEGKIDKLRIRDDTGELVLAMASLMPIDRIAAQKTSPEAARETLSAICGLVRASMPSAVRQAFVEQLRDLRDMVRDPAQRDSFSRGVWAGWDSLLTELITGIHREPEKSMIDFDGLSKEPPGHA